MTRKAKRTLVDEFPFSFGRIQKFGPFLIFFCSSYGLTHLNIFFMSCARFCSVCSWIFNMLVCCFFVLLFLWKRKNFIISEIHRIYHQKTLQTYHVYEYTIKSLNSFLTKIPIADCSPHSSK